MVKYLDLLGLTTYDLAIKLYIDNSTPESITTEEIEKLFSPNFNPSVGNNAVMGEFSGLKNPLYYLSVNSQDKRCEFELMVNSNNHPWALVDGESPTAVEDAPSSAQLFQDVKSAILSHFADANEWTLINSGTSTSENAPANFARLEV